MKDSQNLTIGLLVLSATILLSMVFATMGDRAYAGGVPAATSQGEYVVASGAWSDTTDLVYIIDRVSQRMNVYFLDRNANRVQRQDSVDLKRVFRED
jgi:hypothetical protein